RTSTTMQPLTGISIRAPCCPLKGHPVNHPIPTHLLVTVVVLALLFLITYGPHERVPYLLELTRILTSLTHPSPTT
ncbi:hypothetical protein, partial [Variovorax defluvii]|uniref:hypothetical protein n=1 Tax=Variovorax defluvii TaxID=913761 RepID=UPI0031EDD82B